MLRNRDFPEIGHPGSRQRRILAVALSRVLPFLAGTLLVSCIADGPEEAAEDESIDEASQALTCACPEATEQLNDACYSLCANGYASSGTSCMATCAAGESDNGSTCTRPASSVAANTSRCPWYDVCGLTFAKGCSTCPAGTVNNGCSCTVPSTTYEKARYVRTTSGAPVCTTTIPAASTTAYNTTRAATSTLYYPPVIATPSQETTFSNCLSQATSNQGVAAATGSNLDAYKGCLKKNGYDFLVSPRPSESMAAALPWQFWVYEVNQHCAVNMLGVGIGNDYNRYKNCLRDRGVEPSVATVDATYLSDTLSYCWGNDKTSEKALSWMLIIGTTLAGPPDSPIALLKAYDMLKFGLEIADLAMDASKIDGDYDFVKIDPRPLVDYGSYERCLADRSVPGLDFKPVHTGSDAQLAPWSQSVDNYCYGIVVGSDANEGWQASKLRQCMVDRHYPVAGIDMDHDGAYTSRADVKPVDDAVYHAAFLSCDDRQHPRSSAPTEYAACMRGIGVALSSEDTAIVRDAVIKYCSGAVAYSRAESYNEYERCLSDRGVAFDASDSAWQSEVRSYCARAVAYSRVESYNEYKQCLSDRSVAFDANDPEWQSELKKYCSGAIAYSRVESYNEYKKCLTDRGGAFVVDDAWTSEAIAYCKRVVATSPAVSYNEYKKCLSDRSVALDTSPGGDWCQNQVKPYCNKQSYPFGGKERCFSDRFCAYPI